MTLSLIMKTILFHRDVAKQIEKLSLKLRIQVVESLDLLATGLSIGMPLSRPIPDIAHGVHELRVKDQSGQYRVFYYTKSHNSLIVFHFLKKKTQKLPVKELKLARQRLRSIL